ncbi:phage tail tape measure protein [Devosia ginsengisoli]|uniref:phage tail tape measure protein n=1 Tax=Devosia ginsengisoli TaxID=400770 RepID=UPI0026EE599A|nr:phage tail tape measure protein [Devosia ginsengisoli]MCR6672211.1 phage tail tape measure protein [Devosia ginsengisoli]
MGVLTSKLIVALIDQITAPARGVARVMTNLQAASRANAMQMNQVRGQMVDAAAAAYALGRAIADPIGKAVAFESAMADVGKVSDFSASGLAAFGQDLRRLSMSEIPMAVTELAALAENAAASGIVDSELLDFTRGTAKAALAWGVAGAQAGEDLAKIKTALRLSVSETMLFADAINLLADRTASTAPDLTNFTRRVAAQGEFFGFSKEETLAFGSAMISAGAESEVAATSFRNMGRALTKGTSATAAQQRAFKRLGLDATKVAKGMQEDAVGTTLEVIKRLGQLPAEMQAATMGDLFGDEARALAPLLGNLQGLETTLGYVADETQYAGSVAEEFAKRAATTEFNLQRLKNQVDGIALAIGNALLPAINGVAEAVGPVIIAMADWAAANPEMVLAIVSLVGGLVALRVAAIATRWAFLFMKGGILDAALLMTKGVAAFLALVNPLNLVKNAITALRLVLMMSGVGLAIAAIAAAGLWIYNNWSGLTAFFEGFGRGFMAAFEPLMPAIQPVIDAGQAMLDWVTALLGPVDASNEEWASWGETVGTLVAGAILKVIEIGKTLLDFYVGFYPAVYNAIGDLIGLGGRIMQMIWDGIAAKFQEMLGWFAQWPGMILDAIGKIDLSSAFTGWIPGMGGAITAPVQGNGGHTLYPVGQAPGVAGARAAGGAIASGQTYLVGEHGPELVTPGRSGYVHDAGATAGMLGASVSVSVGDIIVQGGSDPQATAEAVLQMLERRLKDALGGIYADIEFA